MISVFETDPINVFIFLFHSAFERALGGNPSPEKIQKLTQMEKMSDFLFSNRDIMIHHSIFYRFGEIHWIFAAIR